MGIKELLGGKLRSGGPSGAPALIGKSAGDAAIKGLRSLRAPEFHLLRYFTLASMGLFLVVFVVINLQELDQRNFFAKVQNEQSDFVKSIQGSFAKTQEAEARAGLLTIHEAGNVNLTRLFANALWERDFAPFIELAKNIDVEPCRAIADVADDKGKMQAPAEKKACYSDAGKKIMALPGFRALDARVYDMMKKSTVFKIKVFDLRGITVYSSEHKQIGEDKVNNAGWKGAVSGKPTSELTHRKTFSAFEGTVENRDLISSYLPVLQPGSQKIVGVFEVYSDVTPFLNQIKETSARINRATAEDHARLESVAEANLEKVSDDSLRGVVIVFTVLGLLFAGLFFIVRRAHLLIATQRQEKDRAQQQLTQSEKMASLGQMVAGVAHQLNTPLAFTKSNVELAIMQIQAMEPPVRIAAQLAEAARQATVSRLSFRLPNRAELEAIDVSSDDVMAVNEMLNDVLHGVEQMSEMVSHMRTFTRLDRSKVGEVDLNKNLHSVVYIARSVIPNRIELREQYGDMQSVMCHCVPSQLNQVFLNLINNAAQAIEGSGSITVCSALEATGFRIEFIDTGKGIADDVLPHIFDAYFTTKDEGEGTGLGLSIARDIVQNHGGEIKVVSKVGSGTTFTVTLPLQVSSTLAAH